MRGARVLLSLACLSVLLASAAPAAAFIEDMDVIASAELSSGDWVAFRIRVNETTIVAEGGTRSIDSRYSYAVDATWRLDAQGRYRGAGLGQSWSGDLVPSVYLHTDATGTISRREAPPRAGGGGGWGGSTFQPGEYIFVTTTAAVGTAYSYTAEVLAEGDVELVSMTRGSSGFMHRQEDFGGTASLHVDTPGGMAKALVGGSVSEQAGSKMFAMLRDGGDVTATNARIVGPAGFESQGWNDPVIWGSWEIVPNGPAGGYAFEVDTSASASAVFSSELLAIGADVVLP